jgi:hypothetical protein
MMSLSKIIVAFIFFSEIFISSPSSANSFLCSSRNEIISERMSVQYKSWSELHKNYIKYRNCDDGAIAEGFSESTTVLLEKKWGDFTKNYFTYSKDKNFIEFIIKHIDATTKAERLIVIKRNAENFCSAQMKEFCNTVILQSVRAINEL